MREVNLKHDHVAPVHHRSLLKKEGFGTAARVEREYKWSVGTPGEDLDLASVAEGIREALAKAVSDRSLWKAAQVVGNDFYIDDTTEDFVFRDIYFDTPDSLNAKFGISYRLRNRFIDWKKYKLYEKNPNWPELWPYRLEYQAKTNRKELGNGYSVTDEARFEFRKESLPFSEAKLPPPRPWNLDQFMPYFQIGEFQSYPLLPAQEILRAFENNGVVRDSFEFAPTVVLLTERNRMHLNIKSPYGSGPNPEQSYIISLDKSRVYDGKRYVQFIRERGDGYKSSKRPPDLGDILEIEIEFERNVSDVLDRQITEAQQKGDTVRLQSLEGVRDAFLADQEQIMKVVQKAFAEDGIRVRPEMASKYLQAYKIAYGDYALEKLRG